MHDILLAKEIVAETVKQAQKRNLKKIQKVGLILGSLIEHGEEINETNLKDNFDFLSKGTLIDGAALLIKRRKISGYRIEYIITK